MIKFVYNKQISLIISIISFLILIYITITNQALKESTWLFNPETLKSGIWTPVLHKTFNSFILWKNLSFLSFSNTIQIELLAFSIIFIFNLFILFKSLKTNTTYSLIYSIIIILIIFSFLGLDLFWVKAISFFPLLVFTITKLNNIWLKTFFILSLSTLINLLSFSFTPLILLFTLLAVYLLAPKKLSLFLIVIIFLPSIIFFNLYSLTPKTDYPNDAKVVEDDGLPGHLRPAFANMSNIPFVNRVLVRNLNQEPALIILILIFFYYLNQFTKNKSLRNRSANILLVFALFILADVALPEEFASIFPLATLKRLIPYFYHYPLAPYFLIFLIIAFTATAIIEKKQLSLSIFFLLISTFIACKDAPLLIDKKLNKLIKNSKVKDYQKYKIVSPAYALIPKLGTKVFFKKRELDNLKYKSLNHYNVRVTKANFRKGSKRRFIFDNNPATRFRTKQQYAKEWVHLAFKREKKIKGISLQTGYYPSDFPRGIRISSKENCKFGLIKNKKNLVGYNEVYKKQNWIGSYKFTPNGLLYLTAEGVVNLIFDKTINTKCLLIEQTGNDDFFDWSIAEIKLIMRK